MKAILFFHIRVGARLAIQSFIPLFCAMVVLIMLQMNYVAFVTTIATSLFGQPPSAPVELLLAVLAFAFPVWASPRMAHGLNGWLRHLPIDSRSSRRGLALGLLVVQTPLALTLVILGVVASVHGVPVRLLTLVRFLLLLAGGALAALPIARGFPARPLAAAAALSALLGDPWMVWAAAPLLLMSEAISGPIETVRSRRIPEAASSYLAWRIAWRALGWGLVYPYFAGLLPLGAAALFISNNELTGSFRYGAAGFGGAISVTFFLSIVSERLAVRRPVWPWARSLPWSSGRRIMSDATFLAVHSVPLALMAVPLAARSAAIVLLLIPLLSLRAATHMRRIYERRSGIAFVLEGFFVSSLCALAPWTVFLMLAAAPAAFASARSADSRQKVTRWLEKHHETGGDSLSWSD